MSDSLSWRGWIANSFTTGLDYQGELMNTSSILSIIGRDRELFEVDFRRHEEVFHHEIAQSRFLVMGGAGSIGSAVVRELFARGPRTLHVVDISENSLAELVRDLRSSLGYTTGDFQAFCFDGLGSEFEALAAFLAHQGIKYDYVLNFSALKHVRSEKDPFTLMRLIDVNVMLTRQLLSFANSHHAKKFFCVSTDKAANPVNMMGGSKRIMEMFLHEAACETKVSTARFANVAFSDGSLPHSWRLRLLKRQPLVAPVDIKRYFLTSREAAILCLFSVFEGQSREILFPRLSPEIHLTTFVLLAERFLQSMGYEPLVCETEEAARACVEDCISKNCWPCYFFNSDTTGEKESEEFYTLQEDLKPKRYEDIGIVENNACATPEQLGEFLAHIRFLRARNYWSKQELLQAFSGLLPGFSHHETGRHLDQRM